MHWRDELAMENFANNHNRSASSSRASPTERYFSPRVTRCNRKDEYTGWAGSGLTSVGKEKNAVVTDMRGNA